MPGPPHRPLPASAEANRNRAEGGHGHHDTVTYEGLTLHKPATWHVYTGQAFAGLMW